MPSQFQPNSLYLSLNYLETDNGKHNYHWGLYVTGSTPPAGTLYHASNVDRRTRTIVPYRYENRPVTNDPTSSKSMVVSLLICPLPPTLVQYMDINIRPFEPLALKPKPRPPRGESDWNCRVWAKEILNLLQEKGVAMPADTNTIERQALLAANTNLRTHLGNAKVINDLSWLRAPAPRHAPPAPATAPAPAPTRAPAPARREGGGQKTTGDASKRRH
ncbi:uncharacterized protein B0T15DRAFT_502973 [Chaetomium strumarium]|uniref:Uncharacterized protein n=1 Tax=Chaetomium strumarium TaxID=1170767 RepID=A0AAJ0GTM4_9PEZI|nr:hypothetical protein B0T15DRAFT_502973 [Chaetomium strumarium]